MFMGRAINLPCGTSKERISGLFVHYNDIYQALLYINDISHHCVLLTGCLT